MATDEAAFESEFTRDEIADWFEAFARDLRGDGPCDVSAGDLDVVVNPSEPVRFAVEVEDDGSSVGDDLGRTMEFTLEWMVQEDSDGMSLE